MRCQMEIRKEQNAVEVWLKCMHGKLNNSFSSNSSNRSNILVIVPVARIVMVPTEVIVVTISYGSDSNKS